MYKKILVAAEFDEIGLSAIKEAIEMAKLYQAALSVMHVIEPSLSHCYTNFQKEGGDEEGLLEYAKKEKMALLQAHNMTIDNLYIKRGLIKAEIPLFIEENHIDLLIVGSHSKKGLELMLGSKANKLVQSVPCHVLIIRK